MYVSINSGIGFYLILGLFWGLGQGLTTVFGYTQVVEQHSFSMFLSILTFEFDLILGSFFTFWSPNGLFLGLGQGSTTVLGSTPHVPEQLSFSMFLSILTLEFDLILGSFFTLWGPNGIFLGLEQGSSTVLGSTYVVEHLSSSLFLSILTFDFDLILG